MDEKKLRKIIIENMENMGIKIANNAVKTGKIKNSSVMLRERRD